MSALNAALVNGTASHAMDFDDVHASLGGHPSAMLTPALFALADLQATSRRDFIAAFVAGFETETRVGKGVNYHHYEKGWHPTVTLGIFGTAAACANLLRLDTYPVEFTLTLRSGEKVTHLNDLEGVADVRTLPMQPRGRSCTSVVRGPHTPGGLTAILDAAWRLL